MAADNPLRARLESAGLVHAPGVVDAVSARIARAAGFDAVHLSGAAVSATRLGRPDLGFVHGTDIAQVARELRSSLAGAALIADADTGYGGPLQVRATTELYAAAGVSALHIEDQVNPKRCGHLAGKAVVEIPEAASRIRAAVDAGTGVVVIARTDALPVHGLDDVLLRVDAFVGAGADLCFVEGAELAALQELHVRRPGVGWVFNRSEAAGTDHVDDDAALAAAGVRVVIHPVAALVAAAAAWAQAYDAIRRDGSAAGVARWSWQQLTDLVGQPDALALADSLG